MIRKRNQQKGAVTSDRMGKTARIGLRIDSAVHGDAAPYPSCWRSGSLELGPARKIWLSVVSRSSGRTPFQLDLDELGVMVTSIRDVSREERRHIRANRFRVLVCQDAAGRGFRLAIPSDLAASVGALMT